uniref:Transmembrane protein n=1 Tax=Fagus sylvatica TaxID=28930 RepID=A0A2N9IJ89_FAGSY
MASNSEFEVVWICMNPCVGWIVWTCVWVSNLWWCGSMRSWANLDENEW